MKIAGYLLAVWYFFLFLISTVAGQYWEGVRALFWALGILWLLQNYEKKSI